MSGADVAKVVGAVFVAAVLQTSIVASLDTGGGAPDLLLVVLVMVALLRGSVVGAAAGFFGGLLVDTATLEALGVTSLLLTTAGYWIGRYGETTGRDRSHAPLVSVFVVTIAYAVGGYALHFLLGGHVSARAVLLEALPSTLLFNVLLAVPLYALCRRLLPPRRAGRMREVALLG